MKLIYGVKDKPKFGQIIVFALQQLLAILAATIAVPFQVGHGMSQAAALFGAGVGTIVYLLFTKFKSPVFLGSSFAFIPSMLAAFAGATASVELGYVGLILGAIFAGLVYVILAVIVKFSGTAWINKIMPAAIIGPTVAIIGLSLASAAVQGSFNYAASQDANGNYIMTPNALLCLLCALVTMIVVIICSVYGKKMLKMIPFIIGIVAGYAVASVISIIGIATGNADLQIINFIGFFDNMQWIPDFSFIKALGAIGQINGQYILTIVIAYVPVAFVVFAEHIADHKNLSSIIESDLLEDPGLSRTLLGDGIGSMAGAFFGGCPNTTYGESVGCVAISGNASIITILVTAIMAVVASFIGPFVTILASIPGCVMGGVCITLYGFIAVSGLKMIQNVDLGDNKNLFPVSVVLICGIGGMALAFAVNDSQSIVLTSIAVALILGIVVNLIVHAGDKKNKDK